MTPDSLRIATRYFYWKPAQAFFRAFELEEYARAEVRFEHPTLDLGCGDGTVAAMLRERGVLDSIEVALDYSLEDLRRAREKSLTGTVRADVRALPLGSGTIASVVCNGVLGSLRAEAERDIDRSIAEVYRLLSEGGVFVLTVPTPSFNRNLVIPRTAAWVRGSAWMQRYLTRLERGLDHYFVLEEERWVEKLEGGRFSVEQVRPYFTPRQGRWWNLLTLQVVRVFALSKLLGRRWSKRLAADLQQRLFQRIFLKEQAVDPGLKRDRAGFLLIVARKEPAAAGRAE